jgi:hypothetical protein
MSADEVQAKPPVGPWAAAAASKTQRGAKDGSNGIDASSPKPCLKVGAGAKRPALGPAGGSASADDYVSGDVGALLADIRAEFSNGLASTQDNVLKVIEKHATGYNKRLDDANTKINFLGSENVQRKSESSNLRKDVDLLQAEIGQLRQSLALEAAKPRSKSVGAPLRGPDDCDPTLVRLTAKNLVGLDAVQLAATALLERAGFSDGDATLKGPQVGRYFSLNFGGEESTAARRAKKTADCLRTNAGKWETISVCRPGQQGNEQLQVGLDRSPNEIRKGRHLYFLLEAVRETHPALLPWKLPREGVLTVAWQTVAGFVPGTNFDKIDWKPSASSHGIDTGKVEEAFESKMAEFADNRTKRL